VVCASGRFELLHPGHIRLLEQARSFGDILVVVLESDRCLLNASSGAAHGASLRPVVSASERAEILAEIGAVDYVVDLESSSIGVFLMRIVPDVFVSGGAANDRDSHAREIAEIESLGCRIVRVAREPGYSTTALTQRILDGQP